MQLRAGQFGAALLFPVMVAVAVCVPGTAMAAIDSGAAVTGVVRDVQGIAQAGALVQVMTAGLDTPKTAFTDMHGRYSIVGLDPRQVCGPSFSGVCLFLPQRTIYSSLQGKWAVVNLTLADAVSMPRRGCRRSGARTDETGR